MSKLVEWLCCENIDIKNSSSRYLANKYSSTLMVLVLSCVGGLIIMGIAFASFSESILLGIGWVLGAIVLFILAGRSECMLNNLQPELSMRYFKEINK